MQNQIQREIREIDAGNIRYGCGHGAVGKKEHEISHTDMFCDTCIVDLPQMAQREMKKKARYWSFTETGEMREHFPRGIRTDEEAARAGLTQLNRHIFYETGRSGHLTMWVRDFKGAKDLNSQPEPLPLKIFYIFNAEELEQLAKAAKATEGSISEKYMTDREEDTAEAQEYRLRHAISDQIIGADY